MQPRTAVGATMVGTLNSCPSGCEVTGIAYTPDLKTFFINIQHPTGTWPSRQCTAKPGETLDPGE